MWGISIILGLVAGIASGFFGIGGGAILVPSLMYILGLTQHQAQGTTLAIMIPPIGLLAALKYYQQGNVNLSVAVFVCLGVFIGGFLGAHLAHKLPEIVLKRAFGALLLILSIKMIFGK
ncbi:MAG: sulfite exporter TauE/SafE family protein [Candidatus Omnitrophica bacterium]|nr:sulfite exporter TauE/SafE family protein [Candidatus Omnitrophota bacterium]